MPYIGTSPSNGVRRVFDYTATAGQTSFSGSDNNSQTLAYTDSAYIDVYQNGILLIPSDYTATTGTTVVLDTGATVSDTVQIVAYDVFSVADTVSASDGGSFGGNLGVGGTLNVTGIGTFSDDIIIGDGKTIGSASDVDAITIGSDGDVTLTQDLELQHDGAILSFGADDDTTLTHTDGSGLTLNSTNKLMFNDASQFIQGASATVLDIAATDEIELTATLIEVVGNATVSGTLGVTGVTTSNAGVVVDNITIDGTEIDLSSGDLTLDVAGDIILDADGGDLKFSDGGTALLGFTNSSSDVVIKPLVDTKDIIFHQYDGTSILEINDGGYARFTAAAINPEATLSDGSTISWNALTQPVAKVTLGGNRTLAAASGGVAGQFVSLLIIQDGTGSRTVTFNAAYEFASDTAPTLTTTASLGDLFVFRYNGSKWLEVGRNLALTLS